MPPRSLAAGPLRRLRVPLSGPLDLEATLYSGQAFRWTRLDDGAHEGFIENQPCRVRWTEEALEVESLAALSPTAVIRYFRLDAAHDAFLSGVRRDPSVTQALERFPGLRLLRQDPWEMLVSFVISQNSNEAKIRKTIQRLCQRAGEVVPDWSAACHRFPRPASLAALTPSDLRSTGMGYRARFVQAVADEVNTARLDPKALASMPYENAHARLLQIDGIGAKVADCVLLYGCDQQLAFPSDVWVRRFLRETYLRRAKNPNPLRIREFAWKHFGPYAGYAQHYLFHYRRTVGKLASSDA